MDRKDKGKPSRKLIRREIRDKNKLNTESDDTEELATVTQSEEPIWPIVVAFSIGGGFLGWLIWFTVFSSTPESSVTATNSILAGMLVVPLIAAGMFLLIFVCLQLRQLRIKIGRLQYAGLCLVAGLILGLIGQSVVLLLGATALLYICAFQRNEI